MMEKTLAALPRRRRVLYVTGMAPFGTTTFRYAALQRLGQDVQPFDWRPYAFRFSLLNSIRNRYPLGPLVSRVNRDLRRAVQSFRPDVVWFDKPIYFTPATMRAIHQAGARIVFYVQDGPFGPRKDGYWRQFYRVFRMADLHCLVREADVARYRAWDLPWIKTMFSFDPVMQFPPPAGWSDADRDRELSYIGHPHEERPKFLLGLAEQHGLPLSIDGNGWQSVFSPEQLASYVRHGHLLGDAYREHIWKSKINLSFVTHDNEDDIAHKSVEIAACGSFLLALRTPGHLSIFEEDREAVFFSSVEECADKARFYLGRSDLREQIGRKAHERALRSGYDNDSQLSRILNRLDGKQESG
ncbi:CgeB family protein [Paracidobacterium acidisoli]|uniref:Glycosyltransferase family 1 protein n=1 Tax=Paracidobacterium acidisoli TaxID=2303751 RepID=A0A372IRI2_9BACT|nr:glycosyltransferase [Paracidobacterium acidisoli]MBT9330419.1 glycosyltransferase [Paracidobacterium acidisoli]